MSNVRKTFPQLAVGMVGFPGAEVARYLGVTTSSINRLAVSSEAADLKKCQNSVPGIGNKVFASFNVSKIPENQ